MGYETWKHKMAVQSTAAASFPPPLSTSSSSSTMAGASGIWRGGKVCAQMHADT